MFEIAEQRLFKLIEQGGRKVFADSRIGIEKESLRVTPDGQLAQTPHPRALGSALTHPYITTDYSEAMPELITPPAGSIAEALAFLRDIHRFVYENLEQEMLWATSMPCVVAGETSIPIAQYGRSNRGLMKTVYRRGLGHRYGRVMQTISGVHFNYSFAERFWEVFQAVEGDSGSRQDFIADRYFGLIRNLQRFGWLVPYLFGASPAVCKSFLGGRASDLDSFDAGTYYQPFATSLRMGDIGYQNNQEAKNGVKACYDNLEAYVQSLNYAITTPCPDYANIGVKVDGEYRQLNDHILQIENEYYSTIRPKQITASLEKPVHALKQRGVAYVELRSIDVNAFDPLGINDIQCHFLEAFLVFCLLHDSPVLSEREREEIDHNELAAAHRGRDAHLRLHREGKRVPLRDWASDILNAMLGVCEVLDNGHAERPYSRSLAEQHDKVRDPELTPSARMLAEMRANNESFFHLALRKSRQHQACFRAQQLAADRRAEFDALVQSSLQKQQQLEDSETLSFDEFLQQYFAQTL